MKKLYYTTLIGILTYLPSHAQPAALDTTFNIGTGASATINHLMIQPNDKLIIAGMFTGFNNVGANRVVRLLPDGTVDPSWITSGGGANHDIRGAALQLDGKVVIGGIFTTYNTVTANRLVRVDSVGNIDTTFVVGTGPNNEVRGIETNTSRVIIHGFFNQYQGEPVPNFAVLLHNGQRDTTFALPTQTFFVPTDIKLLPNNKFYMSGNFTMYNNDVVNRLVRINPDGSRDSTFNTGTGFNSQVGRIVVQSDGKVILSGSFSNFNGTPVPRIVRLHPNGNLDTSFNVSLPPLATVAVAAVDAQGRVFVHGSNQGIPFFKRLLPDGSDDLTFDVGTGFNGGISQIDFQSTQKIIVTGTFTNYQGVTSRRIARLLPDSCIPATPPVIQTQNQYVNCPGGSTILYVNDPPNNNSTQWNWYEGSCSGNLIGVGDSITVSPGVATTYFVGGGGNCVGGCAQIYIGITDTMAPVPDVPTLPDLTGLCEVTVTQTPTATDACMGPITATTQSPLSYTAKGNYAILWNYNDGNNNTSTQVQNVIVTGIDATVRFDTLPNLSLEISANYTSPSAQYQWLDCDSNMMPIPGETNPSYIATGSGNYAVAISDSGCTDTSACQQVNVSQVGLPAFAFDEVLIFPNPAKETLRVHLPERADEIRIYALTGTLLRVVQPAEKRVEIPISNLPSGIYLLEIVKNDSRSFFRFGVQ